MSHNSHQHYTRLVLRMLLSGKAEDRICDELNITREILAEQIDFLCDQFALLERSMLSCSKYDVSKDTMNISACDGLIAVIFNKTSGYITDVAPQGHLAISSYSYDVNVDIFIKTAKRKLKVVADYLVNPSDCNQEALRKLFQVFRIYYDYGITANGNETPAMTAGVSLKKVDFFGMFK